MKTKWIELQVHGFEVKYKVAVLSSEGVDLDDSKQKFACNS